MEAHYITGRTAVKLIGQTFVFEKTHIEEPELNK